VAALATDGGILGFGAGLVGWLVTFAIDRL
jgi:hypothetical protein